MIKCLLLLASAATLFAQDYKVEPIASAAPELPAAYTSLIEGQGYRVVGPKGPWCEIWLRKSVPAANKPADPAVALPYAQGTLLGVLRFPGAAEDRRGQGLKPGVYTMRYSNHPVDGAHQGVAPQRDFMLLTPIANDPNPAALPEFMALVEMSRTSGTAHPAVFSLASSGESKFPAITKEGEHDIVLHVKLGDVPVAIIVAGRAEG
jgi:hypothetical protein